MTSLRRMMVEKRAFAVPLLVVLVVNLLVYFLVVAPLAVKSSTAAERAAAAALARIGAERDRAAARELVVGKARAEQELMTFYEKMLPSSFEAARRMTYARLPAMARRSNVRYEAGTFEVDQDTKSPRLGRLHIRMILQGEYDSLRRFIYDLETSSDFVIIDDLTMTQDDVTKPLKFTLELSSYYTKAHGT
jgi:hypothetical protein